MGQGPGLSPLPGLGGVFIQTDWDSGLELEESVFSRVEGGVRDEEEDLESESLTGEAREGYPRKGRVQVEFSLPRLRG